jgi:hypothetical protein
MILTYQTFQLLPKIQPLCLKFGIPPMALNRLVKDPDSTIQSISRRDSRFKVMYVLPGH